MADPSQLALIKRSVQAWNAWRVAHLSVKVNLRGADLRGADLSRSGLRGADLGRSDLSRSDLRNANLSEADLSRSDLIGANLRNANLFGADLTGADLSFADLTGADFNRVKGDAHLPKNITSEPHPNQSPVTTDWLSTIQAFGNNLLLTAAALGSVIQALDVMERRWREHQEKHKQQSAQIVPPASTSSTQPAASPSQKTSAQNKEIVEILLVMDDGNEHGFKRWISDPDELRKYIDAFSDPQSPVKPVLSELKQHLGTKADFCYPSCDKNGNGKPQQMKCPYCAASTARKRTRKTELGYATFFCSACQRTFNERTGTSFNYLEVPTDIVLLVVLWRLRSKLSLRDIAEMFASARLCVYS